MTVFESKRRETWALMAEKAKVCGPDYGKSATPAKIIALSRGLPTVRIVNVARGVP